MASVPPKHTAPNGHDHGHDHDHHDQEHDHHHDDDHHHHHHNHPPADIKPGHIALPCVAALTWVLKDSLGEELDVLDEPVEFLVGGDDLLPDIDTALVNSGPGDKLDLHLEPEHAFGDYKSDLVFLQPRKLFPKVLEEGMTFDGHALPAGVEGDLPKDALYTVTDIYPDHVVLDGNHPLAGISLRLALKVHAVREATIDEVGSGTAGATFFKVG